MQAQQNAFVLEPYQIDMLIENEKRECKPGYEGRIQSLQAMKCKELPARQGMTENLTITQPRLAEVIRSNSKLLNAGPPSTYLIALTETKINVKDCKSFYFGEEKNRPTPNRIIMCMGATGSGKTTLINGMINYILDVKWDDKFRFILVDEEQSKSQAHSQTSLVTAYKINHQDYSVTIIDTPGFGDTRGIKRDRMITDQLRSLFSSQCGITHIDTICFVVQASQARLTPTQRYVFDSVLSIFGKDVAENIRMLVTFADGKKPPVLDAIKESGLPCPKNKNGDPMHFKFNNSALFADNNNADDKDDIDSVNEMFWKMGVKSMSNFFSDLTLMTPKSLLLTNEVLKERQQLEVSIENLDREVKLGIAKSEQIATTSKQIRKHEADIIANKNFKITKTYMKPSQKAVSKGRYVTNCVDCQETCHKVCQIPNDNDKKGCAAMDSNGYCKHCPGKCFWNKHHNFPYIWVYEEVKEIETVQEVWRMYKTATQEKFNVQVLIDRLNQDYDDQQLKVVLVMERSAKCLERLNEIALKPNPLSTPEYIDLLIEGEKNAGTPGYMGRIHELEDAKSKALLLTSNVAKKKNPLQGRR